MLIDDVKFKIGRGQYNHISNKRKNKLKDCKIKLVGTDKVFFQLMYRLGVIQSKQQYVSLITDEDYFARNKHQFQLNNRISVNRKTLVFSEAKHEKSYRFPYGEDVDIYTRKRKETYYHGTHSRNLLDIAYVTNGKLFLVTEE